MTCDPSQIGRFEFVKLASLRAAQLMRGCRPLVPECGKRTTTARHEVAGGKICGMPRKAPRVVPL